jgi:biotin synthase
MNKLLKQSDFTRNDLIHLLSTTEEREINAIRDAAFEVLKANCGTQVYFRGLIEFSNICASDCFYCGIRRGNTAVNRYCLSKESIVESAQWCAEQGYGSVVLQSGERNDAEFVRFVEEAVLAIKQATASPRLPQGVGITLSLGQQSRETYRRWLDAGAHRYLMRIETSSEALFAAIHPPTQKFAGRVRCLQVLKELGYTVGTGVMIGLPGQAVAHLADDILFFRDMDIDMIGMGPYIVHQQTPMAGWPQTAGLDREKSMRLALLMIAATRLTLKDVNIAATTALQALDPIGREAGLQFGANVIMPQLTPTEFRKDYLLYEGKPCLDESKELCRGCLEMRIKGIGREIAVDSWGDPQHALKRQAGRD